MRIRIECCAEIPVTQYLEGFGYHYSLSEDSEMPIGVLLNASSAPGAPLL